MNNFSTLCPRDLAWLTPDQVVDTISNTFESKVISNQEFPKYSYITIESTWHILDRNEKWNLLRYQDNHEFLTQKYRIYFLLYIHKDKYDQFLILRGEKNKLDEFVGYAKSKNSNLTNDPINDRSVILHRPDFCQICWSTYPVPGEMDSISVNDKFHNINAFGALDVSGDSKTFTYFSDLLIGSHLELFGKENLVD
jgi:hypothetical protein